MKSPGAWRIGEILYPDVFDIDLRRIVAKFHIRVHHQAPTAAQLDALLGEPGVLGK